MKIFHENWKGKKILETGQWKIFGNYKCINLKNGTNEWGYNVF